MSALVTELIQDLRISGRCDLPKELTDAEFDKIDLLIKEEWNMEYSTVDINELIANEQGRYGDIPTHAKARLYLLDC